MNSVLLSSSVVSVMFLVCLHSFTVCFINISIIKPLYVSSVISHELIKHPQTASRLCVCLELSFIHCVHIFMLSFVQNKHLENC